MLFMFASLGMAFQSTLPCEERPGAASCGRRGGSFNPRSRVRSDALGGSTSMAIYGFQSTLPCEERHDFSALGRPGRFVSIHAPV